MGAYPRPPHLLLTARYFLWLWSTEAVGALLPEGSCSTLGLSTESKAQFAYGSSG